MNDSPNSGNRWETAQPGGNHPEPSTPELAVPGAGTAVQERPEAVPGTGQPPGVQKASLKDRIRHAPGGAKLAAGSAAAVVALAAVGVGGFAIGRATAPPGDTAPGQLGPGGAPRGFPHDDGDGQDFGGPGAPEGSDSGATGSRSGSATSSTWYAVSAPAASEAA